MSGTMYAAASVEADKVLLELADGIGTITLNRPDAGNALDPEMVQALASCMNRVCDDTSTRVVAIRAMGKAFCVGGDINSFQAQRDNLPEFLNSLLLPLHQAIVRLVASGRPIVTVVNGAVGGGGIGLALCGDFVLAEESMKLRCGYSAIGLTPDAGSSWFLAKRAGAVQAKHLFLLNEPRTAKECHALGIVDAVYPNTELNRVSRELEIRLRAGPQRVFARTKALIDTAHERSLETHLQMERNYMVASGGEIDVQEGVTAFLAKRPPRFP